MARLSPDRLVELVSKIYIENGAPKDIAISVANSQAEADLTGHSSHGVRLTEMYIEWISQERLIPDARPSIVQDGGSRLVIDGEKAFGQIVGREAINSLVSKAKEHSIAIAGIGNATHLSRMGEWAELAAEENLGLIGFTCLPNSGASRVAPPGSTHPRLSTNPVVIGLPSFDALEFPLLLDMATSQVAFGKIKQRAAANDPIPGGWTTDYPGKPNPEKLFDKDEGALLPLGGEISGYKGFGLAVMSELFAATISDGQVSGQSDAIFGNQAMFALIDPLQFSTQNRIENRISKFEAYLKSTPRSETMDVGEAAHGDKFLLPGESEHLARRDNLAHGVEISENDVELLHSLRADHDIESPRTLEM